MATTVYAKQKGLNAGLGFSGNFNSGFSPFTTGTLVINDVSPLPGRTTGATASIAQQESISRQYASTHRPDRGPRRGRQDHGRRVQGRLSTAFRIAHVQGILHMRQEFVPVCMLTGTCAVLDRVESPARSGMQFHSAAPCGSSIRSASRWPILLSRGRRVSPSVGGSPQSVAAPVRCEQVSLAAGRVREVPVVELGQHRPRLRRRRRPVRHLGGAGRPRRSRRRRPAVPPPVPRLPRHPSLRPPLDRPEGRRPPPLLRLAGAHRRHRRRPLGPADGSPG